MKLTKIEKGITLVALIITIIILLILAIVSIRAIKDGGILSKTQSAKEVYSEAEEEEKIKLAINQAAIDGIGTIKESYLTPALNEQFGENNWEYTQKKEGEYLVVKIKASQRKYVINVDGTVDIPEDIIVDGEDMFKYDTTIVTGLSADGRKKIEQQVKKGSEVKITIPATHNGVQVKYIGSKAFKDCTSLTNITIPNSVTSIGYQAFYGCTSLTNITIPDSVTEISENLFRDCISLTNVTIPNSVKSIEENAFANCTSLTNITIPDSVTSIGGFAFSSCTSLTNIIIPNSVNTILNGTFINCASLTNVTIGENVTLIRESAFRHCTSLTKIEIPKSVTEIYRRIYIRRLQKINRYILSRKCK